MAGGLNLYGYANGDPVNFSDPFGLCPVPHLCAALVGYALGGAGTMVANLAQGRPVMENVARNALVGGALGLTMGLGATATGGLAAGGIAAEAAVSASAAAGRIPFEGFQKWGRDAVGWGQNAAGAAKAMGEMTAEKAASLDPTKVQAAKAFYENAVANGRGGTAAPARVQLMQRIIDLQK